MKGSLIMKEYMSIINMAIVETNKVMDGNGEPETMGFIADLIVSAMKQSLFHSFGKSGFNYFAELDDIRERNSFGNATSICAFIGALRRFMINVSEIEHCEMKNFDTVIDYFAMMTGL